MPSAPGTRASELDTEAFKAEGPIKLKVCIHPHTIGDNGKEHGNCYRVI